MRLLPTVAVILLCLSNTECGILTEATGSCPSLNVCSCKAASDGLHTVCDQVASVDKLREDIFKLKGTTVHSLALSRLNARNLPALFWDNFTAVKLRVVSSPLVSVDDDAFVGVGSLELLDLANNRLTSIPRALRAIKKLPLLYLSSNRIQTLGDELVHLSSSLQRLSLNTNQITSFHENALKDFTRLQRVALANNTIRDIPATLFRSAPVLELVDLRWNVIEDIGDTFRGLHSLQALFLANNNIHNIDNLAAARLRSLKELSLDNNPMDTAALFGPYEAAVESLKLRNCSLSNVDVIALGCLPRLRYVDLAKNNISYIDTTTFPKTVDIVSFKTYTFKDLDASLNCSAAGTANRTAVLQVINLSFNKVRNINNAFAGLRLLDTLDLTGNEIEYVPDGTFVTNGNLKSLYLDENKIIWLGKNCFRGLTSLKTLSVSRNRLTSLNGSLSYMPAVLNLYVQENYLQRFQRSDFAGTPGLSFIYAFRNNVSDVRGAFQDLHDLQVLLLQDNNLASIHRASFPVSLVKLTRLMLDGNPLHCDCQLSWLHEVAVEVSEERNLICESPQWMKGQAFLNSTTVAMLNSWTEDCDEGCTCTCKDDGSYGKHTYVNCSGANLSRLPERFPKDTFAVDLSANYLQTLDRSLANNTPNLLSLVLDSNLLSEIASEAIPKRLQELSIQNNRFTKFPTDIVSQLNLSCLWLSGNPWSCECEDYPFRLWAVANAKAIKDAGSVFCTAGTNARVSMRRFMELEQQDLCPPMPHKLIAYIVPVLVLLSVSLGIATIYLKRQKQIKVWLYARGLRCVKEYDVDKDKVFDVFLSFSSKDGDWAYDNLVPGLEEAGFSVCTYDRNFKGGFLIQDIIQEAVACSRRTLLLLTQNFVRSEWCRWEFRVAHQCALKDKMNRLIIVVIGGIPDGVDDDLLIYMRATNYLRWEEKHFWDKLKYSLPKKDAQQRTMSHKKRVPPSIICKEQNFAIT